MNPEIDDLDAAAERWGVEPVLAALGERIAEAPPRGLRDAVLRRAAAAPRAAVAAVAPVELYRSRAVALAELLRDLGAEEWQLTAAPYEWSIHGLVAHLLQIERHTARQFGLDGSLDERPQPHLAVGSDEIARELADEPTHTRDRWWHAVQRLEEHLRSDGYDPAAPAPLHGWPFTCDSALVARAFELWTHGDDVRRATGRPLDVPSPGELRTMSTLSVSSLPLVVPTIAPDASVGPTRFVLTGDGGGTFDIGGEGERELLVVVDVVDYCRLAARRIAPADLAATVEGDVALLPPLWEAARAFAV